MDASSTWTRSMSMQHAISYFWFLNDFPAASCINPAAETSILQIQLHHSRQLRCSQVQEQLCPQTACFLFCCFKLSQWMPLNILQLKSTQETDGGFCAIINENHTACINESEDWWHLYQNKRWLLLLLQNKQASIFSPPPLLLRRHNHEPSVTQRDPFLIQYRWSSGSSANWLGP